MKKSLIYYFCIIFLTSSFIGCGGGDYPDTKDEMNKQVTEQSYEKTQPTSSQIAIKASAMEEPNLNIEAISQAAKQHPEIDMNAENYRIDKLKSLNEETNNVNL